MSAESSISPDVRHAPNAALEPAAGAPVQRSDVQRFLRTGLIFVLIGLLLYAGLYAAAERLVYQNTVRNRFFTVKTAPLGQYDNVILGASHAYAMDYEDMTARLAEMTDSSVLNLSAEGAGITVNRVFLDYYLMRSQTVLDYLLTRHRTKNVIYIIDSFAFYSPEWNEDRLKDTRVYNRAPFDLRLVWLMLRQPATRPIFLDYLFGFAKINNADRFTTDITDEEATRFDRTYRPSQQIDQSRIRYLYPVEVDQGLFDRYMGQLEALMRDLQKRGIKLIVIKPPIPQRMYEMIPWEEQFDSRLTALLDHYGVEFHDFSLVMDEERFYFNSDHLNRTGVLHFFENYLKPVMVE